jgi:hypothetical protein
VGAASTSAAPADSAASEQGGRSSRPRRAAKPPTVRQIYALAAALCAFTDQDFPETRDEASDLIERLRIDIGHPEPWLVEPPAPGRRDRRRARRPRPD